MKHQISIDDFSNEYYAIRELAYSSKENKRLRLIWNVDIGLTFHVECNDKEWSFETIENAIEKYNDI